MMSWQPSGQACAVVADPINRKPYNMSLGDYCLAVATGIFLACVVIFLLASAFALAIG